MKEADYLSIINDFDRYVRLHFDYLETMYGYTSTPSQARYIHEPRDAEVSISYKTETLRITIGLSLIGAGLALTFKNLNWIDIPKDNRVKWLTLDSIIAYRTGNVGKSLLHELTSSRNKYWPNGYLIENMELAIQTLASQVKRYAADLVTGDLSAFLEIGSMNRGKTAK